MTNSARDNAGATHQTEPPVTQGADMPETDDDWFALIQPAIEVSPEDADEDTVTELAQRHAGQVVERTGMAVDLDQVTWRATYELRTNHGYHRNNFIKLSLNSLEKNGWQTLMKVIRHELVHAWQQQNDVDDRPGKNTFERFHGSSFEKWIPTLSIAKRGPRILPNWTIECPECQAPLHTEQKARDKEIAQRIQTLDREVCHECDQHISEYTVKRNDEEIAVASLPDVLSEAQDRIFLYNEPSTTAQSVTREWNPQTRRLTAFTGIGEVTARTLGRNIDRIDELLDGDNRTLATEVQSAVPAPYHKSLRSEVRSWHEEALQHRSAEDIKLLRQAKSCRDYDWWKPVECLDETGTVESMCLYLRGEVKPGDRLQITVEGHGEYTATVVEIAHDKMTTIGVTIDPSSTSLGSQGMIEIPVASRGEYPTLRYEQEVPESVLTTNDNTSDFGHVISREKIIDVEKQEVAP